MSHNALKELLRLRIVLLVEQIDPYSIVVILIKIDLCLLGGNAKCRQ